MYCANKYYFFNLLKYEYLLIFLVLKQHPELTPPEVAVYMNKRWKELPPEEREYYRDLANQHNLNASNSSLSQTLKKPKSQPTEAEKEKNKKQLINMLGNMKMNKAELKNKSMFMRTFVSWDINLESLAKKIKKYEKIYLF